MRGAAGPVVSLQMISEDAMADAATDSVKELLKNMRALGWLPRGLNAVGRLESDAGPREEGLLALKCEYFRTRHSAGSTPSMMAYFEAMEKERFRVNLHVVQSVDDL